MRVETEIPQSDISRVHEQHHVYILKVVANAEVERISHLSKEQASKKTRGPRPNK